MTISAAIFDLGGVVLGSPIQAFREYERSACLPHRFVSELILAGGHGGAWSRFERGELGMPEFVAVFDAEAGSQPGFSGAALMQAVAASGVIRPRVVSAIRTLRQSGLKTAALTNNWESDDQSSKMETLRPEFDIFIESWRVNMRKPDPRIYEHACKLLSVAPSQVVYLDDLGANLKPARAMGMTTIKVVDEDQALSELGAAVGMNL